MKDLEAQRSVPRLSLSLNESYRHFDTLIWQVPSIGMAVGVGVIVGANQIEKADGWIFSVAQLRGVVLLLGAILLAALSVALLKYRVFSSATVPVPLPIPPFAQWPAAGTALQLSISLMTGTILGLSGVQLLNCRWLIFLGLLFGVAIWIFAEARLSAIRKNM